MCPKFVVLRFTWRRSQILRQKVVTEGWSILKRQKFHDFCSSPNVIRAIKSRRKPSVGYVSRIGENKNSFRGFVEKPVERDRGAGGKVLKQIINK
jgi:hypothetical protein